MARWRLTGKKPFLLSLIFFVMIPAKKNWPRNGGGCGQKITGGTISWGGGGWKKNKQKYDAMLIFLKSIKLDKKKH